MEKIAELLHRLAQNAQETAKIDWGQVKYSASETALLAGAVLSALLFLKLLSWGRQKMSQKTAHQRESSGYLRAAEFKFSVPAQLAAFLPKILLLIPLSLVLLTLAKPYFLTTAEISKTVETRTRIDLIDVSGSMAWRFKDGADMSKAEIARQAHLNFLEKRKGKNDRASLWIFSTTPHLVEDFVVDDDLYSMQVASAPWLLTDDTFGSDLPIDSSKIYNIGESGTRLNDALTDIAQQVAADRKEQGQLYGAKAKNKVALLIITDAAANQYPYAGLEMLKEAKVVPYIIFVTSANNSPAANYPIDNWNAEELLSEIDKYGGRYFNAANEAELKEAYREIDRLESAKAKATRLILRNPLHKLFLGLAIACLAGVIIVGIFTEFLWGQRT